MGANNYIAEIGNDRPAPSSFVFCSKYGCRKKTRVSLSDDSWQKIRRIFADRTSDPAEERLRLAEAVGLLESIVGPITNTEFDEPGSFPGLGEGDQLDCVDESLNTTTYLVMLKNDGLITEHRLLGPAHRGYLIDGAWFHFAPVIEENSTGKRFVVDSWFYQNGEKAVVIPLEEWKGGWKP